MTKKLFSTLILALVFVTAALAQTPYSTLSLTGKSVRDALLETSGGHIEIAGVSDGEAKIEVYIKFGNRSYENSSKEEIKQRLTDDYDYDVSVNAGKLTAIVKPKRNFNDWKKSLSVSFKVYLPKEATSTSRTSGGHISLRDLNGDQDFKTSGGHLDIANMGGKLKGATSGGHIKVQNSTQDMRLTTSGGHIEAIKCAGIMYLHTSGGSITLEDLRGNVDAQTSGGNITARTVVGDLIAHTSGGNVRLADLSGSVETSTSGGNIDVAVKELGKFVKITGSGGSVSLELPKNKGLDLKIRGDKIKVGSLSNFDGTIEEDNIDGKLNGGGIPVTVRAGSGRVSLTLN